MNCWTLPQNIYDRIVTLYPTLLSKASNSHRLEWHLVDNLLQGKSEIQLYHQVVRSISSLGSSEPVLPTILEALENLDNLFNLELYDVSIHRDDYIAHKLSRKALYIPNAEVDSILTQYCFEGSIKDTQYVYVLDGKKVTPKAQKLKKVKIEEAHTQVIDNYKEMNQLPSMIAYCKLVNELAKNPHRRKLINLNILNAESVIEDIYQKDLLDPDLTPRQIEDRRRSYKNSLEKLYNSPASLYSLVDNNTPRIFNGNEQNLKRELRASLYEGCYDIDLSRSQLVIIASLVDSQPLHEWAVRDDLWSTILSDLNFPPSHKKYVKKSLYTLCFGGNKSTWIKDPTNKLNLVEMNALRKHPLFMLLGKCCATLRNKYASDAFVEIGGRNFKVHKDGLRSSQALARKVQHIESMIIFALLKEIEATNDRITLIGAFHDGLLCSIADKSRVPSILKALNKVAQKEGSKYGISNIRLEIK